MGSEMCIRDRYYLAKKQKELLSNAITVSPRIFDYVWRLSKFFSAVKLKRETTQEEVDDAKEFLLHTARFMPSVTFFVEGMEMPYAEAKSTLLHLCKKNSKAVTAKELFNALKEAYKNDKKTFIMMFGEEADLSKNKRWRRIIERLQRDPEIVCSRGQQRRIFLWHKDANQSSSVTSLTSLTAREGGVGSEPQISNAHKDKSILEKDKMCCAEDTKITLNSEAHTVDEKLSANNESSETLHKNALNSEKVRKPSIKQYKISNEDSSRTAIKNSKFEYHRRGVSATGQTGHTGHKVSNHLTKITIIENKKLKELGKKKPLKERILEIVREKRIVDVHEELIKMIRKERYSASIFEIADAIRELLKNKLVFGRDGKLYADVSLIPSKKEVESEESEEINGRVGVVE